MSKRHQASRRRTYGRRQHELHERPERYVGVLSWIDDSDMPGPAERWESEPLVHAAVGDWPASRGID
jgi:hypothetical protein